MTYLLTSLPTLLLLVLPAIASAQESGWVAITRAGDTLQNVHLWESGATTDSVFSFVEATVVSSDGPGSIVSNPVGAQRIALRDITFLYHERPSYFLEGVAIGGGLGLAGDIVLATRNDEARFVPFATTFGVVAGGLIATLMSVDESYVLSYLMPDDVRMIAAARLPRARRAGPDKSLVVAVTAAPRSRRVSRESLWLGLGLFGGGFRQGTEMLVPAFGGLDYRLDEHILGLHYINSERGDQVYEDISLHYGRAFTMLGGESYLSAGPGYAWGGAATTRTDSAQAITEYSTFSLSVMLQQQWLVSRWLAIGAGAFVGTTPRYPFAGGILTVSFGDLD